jgi:hypothetical protein
MIYTQLKIFTYCRSLIKFATFCLQFHNVFEISISLIFLPEVVRISNDFVKNSKKNHFVEIIGKYNHLWWIIMDYIFKKTSLT